jgi:hypothetical protein
MTLKKAFFLKILMYTYLELTRSYTSPAIWIRVKRRKGRRGEKQHERKVKGWKVERD